MSIAKRQLEIAVLIIAVIVAVWFFEGMRHVNRVQPKPPTMWATCINGHYHLLLEDGKTRPMIDKDGTPLSCDGTQEETSI